MSLTDGPVWRSPEGQATRLREGGLRTHTKTVQKACADGSLHSHQRCQNGRRWIADAATDVWMRGGSEREQKAACGCVRLASVRPAA